MSDKVVLLDLENNPPTPQLMRELVQRYTTAYIFNLQGDFNYPLADLTEFSSWVCSGSVVILDAMTASEKAFEYAVIVGQLLALLEAGTEVDLISAHEGADILVDMLKASHLPCQLIAVAAEQKAAEKVIKGGKQRTKVKQKDKSVLPGLDAILANPQLLLVKKYIDAVAKMEGKPNSMDTLKNSIANVLKIDAEQCSQIVGMLINLRLVKRDNEQVYFRKKVLKQWADLEMRIEVIPLAIEPNLLQVDQLLAKLQSSSAQILAEVQGAEQDIHQDVQQNFGTIDPVQLQIIQKLNELKAEKPKDIYALRDLLEQLFPKSDVRLLLKEMIDKGYIYWNGHEVLYSHEMFIN